MIDAKTIYELRPEDREKADRSFAQGHGSSPDFSLPSDRAWIEGYAYALATQAQPQEAAPKVPALPPSYQGSSLIGKPGGECAINFHFGNTDEAVEWHESLTGPREAAPSQDAEDAARWREHRAKLDALITYCPTCCQGFTSSKEMTHDQITFECGKAAGRQEVKDSQKSSDFNQWMSSAYRAPEKTGFTIYNMEVAYQAGRESVKSEPSQDAEDAARSLFNAGWKAAARFCNRDDVVADGIVGGGGCPQFEKAFEAARAQEGK